MSLHSIIHHELIPNVQSLTSQTATAERNAASGISQRMEECEPAGAVESRPSAAAAASSPEAMQRVFNVAPLNVTNRRRRLAVTTLIVACNIMQMICNLIGVAGGLDISRRLGVSGIHANWVAAAYPLTQGTFVLVSGRFGAVYGHKNMLLLGCAVLVVFTFACGFCGDFIAFNLMRALSGIGGAFIMPNAVAMIGITNPPGFARNLSLAFFGASAPIGGYLGGLIVGGFLKSTSIVWIAIVSLAAAVPLWALLPREVPVDRKGKIDWIGSFLSLGGLIVFNAVWNQAPAVGWSHPMIIATLAASVVLFVGYGVWEHYFASDPIMPLRIFKAPSFAPLILVVLLNFMATGTLLWYTVAWLQEVRHWTPMQFAIGWTPFGVCGVAAAFLAALLVPRMPAQYVLAIGTTCMLVSNVLIATMPAQQSYWYQVFPSTAISAFSPDLVYTAAQIIASNSVNRSQQGIAGSLVGSLLLYGNSLGLGFASTIESQVGKRSSGTVRRYRSALYFAVGICVVALALDLAFVRLVHDNRDGWADPADADPADEVAAPVATGAELQQLQSRTEQC
ncbi:hypothetical protein DL766_007943 [Monosporascus sp. MC13-8B]|uniref:Major facilitator superfamily (MFS) profile domain-containing protein n=1 Tax=Monosporascus cannonballus TaxID=155416 RepID=A0ABY0GXR9_9PEZI|nr:hypothetical protein DL762_009323 [Monosporascus cannonballus]RYO81358.1 hypothetical protein DL763_008608 [Monosporascus cannonballus]RYP21434.1 hypothetical protein DL766_007943 [Monosporascus sp. MC13-8B]